MLFLIADSSLADGHGSHELADQPIPAQSLFRQTALLAGVWTSCAIGAHRGDGDYAEESCRVVTPKFATDRLINPQMMVTYGPPNDQTGEGHALMPSIFSNYCSITRGICRSCLLSSGFCCF